LVFLPSRKDRVSGNQKRGKGKGMCFYGKLSRQGKRKANAATGGIDGNGTTLKETKHSTGVKRQFSKEKSIGFALITSLTQNFNNGPRCWGWGADISYDKKGGYRSSRSRGTLALSLKHADATAKA